MPEGLETTLFQNGCLAFRSPASTWHDADHTENTSPVLLAACCECVYRAVAKQWVYASQYFSSSSRYS
jgi:hypothetical protein